MKCLAPIMQACRDNDSKLVRTILAEPTTDVSQVDENGRVALHYCAEHADIGILGMIIDANSLLINKRDNDGFTPLNFATIGSNLEGLKLLINRDADINNVDHEKHSLVHWATICADNEMLKEILTSGAIPSTPDLFGAHALHYSTQIYDPDAIKEGMRRTNSELMHTLISNGANANCADLEERTPLHWAASNGSIDAVQILIEAGSDITAEDKDSLTVLHCAASRGYDHIVEYLIKISGNTQLLSMRDRNGSTALFYAVTLGHFDCCKVLLQAGCDTNLQDRKGRSAAHCAAARGQLQVIKLLDQYGASFSLLNHKGDLPIHEAIQSGNIDVVKWLLHCSQKQLNASNNYGRSLLHIAAATGDMPIATFLVDNECIINSLTINKQTGLTPLDIAVKRKHQDVENLLRAQGGKLCSELPESYVKEQFEIAQQKIEIRTRSPGRRRKKPGKLKKKKRKTRSEEPVQSHHSSSPSSKEDTREDLRDNLTKNDSSRFSLDSLETDLHGPSQRRLSPPQEHPVEKLNLIGGEASPSVRQFLSQRNTHRSETARLVEEKKLFQELAKLKRQQIQYSRVQEPVLVEKLANAFLREYGVKAMDLDFDTFEQYEKFLYDNLKLLYQQEREVLKLRNDLSGKSTDRTGQTHWSYDDKIRRITDRHNQRLDQIRQVSKLPINRRALAPVGYHGGKSTLPSLK